jgi:hypothetical protein
MVSPTTIDLRTCASSAQIAPPRSTRTAADRIGLSLWHDSARHARATLGPRMQSNASAAGPARREGIEAPEARPVARTVPRPPCNHLLREVASMGYAATGRRYGVSDNAIRKWLRHYEREHAQRSR